jgi:cysteinyl-tRNA synthetase
VKQRIYDTRQQAVVDFEPRVAGSVGMYVCGPTVQSSPHIGHLRSALVYDQIRRWFAATGHDVTMIRNVTDIDDKILDHARLAQSEGSSEQWWALAYRVEREFTAAYDALGVLSPTYEPRATANIAEMIALIERLIERGHAYQAQDGSASVYFDTGSWPEYGALTRQRREQMEDAADSEPVGKRDPRDFALWKAHREHEPVSASWSSPWGRGRPGWHIECSAMATRYLGEEFDIHGGGLDLRFPHHENELAQSAAAGDGFARHWLHNGLVNTGGQKMSKSLGNSLFAQDLLEQARPIVLRYFLGSAHYRSVLEFSPDSLAEAAAAFERIEGFLQRAATSLGDRMPGPSGEVVAPSELPLAFTEAMLDDFGVPQALAALHGAVRAGNTALDAGDLEGALARAGEVVTMLGVLGLDPRDRVWGTGSGSDGDAARSALDALVSELIERRREARAAKDFAEGDAIRDRLQASGIVLEDGPNETRWSLT